MHVHYAVSGRKGRVLIVDDEEGVRKPIGLMLRQAGYEVVEAEDGGQAIRTLNRDDNPLMIDTILCDINMPKINGKEAIKYFQAQYPTVPVVVLTGFPDLQLALTLLRSGVHDYLVKPVPKDKLLSVIKEAVDHHVILKNQFAV